MMKCARHRGFTLIEIVVIIAIISIIASIAVPYAYKLINQEKESSTMEEMEAIYDSILGDVKTKDGGYVGEMGVLPVNNDLRALAQQTFNGTTQPTGTTDAYGVRYGWFGPYINTGFDATDYLEDEWGVPYNYGDPGTGQIRSAGIDRTFGTGDDIIYPPNPVNTYGDLLVNVYVWDGKQYLVNPKKKDLKKLKVTVYYSDVGVQNSVTLQTPPDADPPYTFLNLHRGNHAVEGECTLKKKGKGGGKVKGVVVIFVQGNGSQTTCDLYLR